MLSINRIFEIRLNDFLCLIVIVPSITVLLSQHCRFRRLNGHDESVVLNFSLRRFSQTTEGSIPLPGTVTEERRSEQNLDAEDQADLSEDAAD